jgi:hypothetical protein
MLVLVHLQSNFFPAKFFFCILEKGILAGKKLLGKRVNLLCKEGFSFVNFQQQKIENIIMISASLVHLRYFQTPTKSKESGHYLFYTVKAGDLGHAVLYVTAIGTI